MIHKWIACDIKIWKIFMTVETSLTKDNYEFIEKAYFFEQLELYGD
jgi:hypothetical protein